MKKLAFLTAAGYFALAFLFAPGVWARSSMCGQAGSCHGDDKVQKCPQKEIRYSTAILWAGWLGVWLESEFASIA